MNTGYLGMAIAARWNRFCSMKENLPFPLGPDKNYNIRYDRCKTGKIPTFILLLSDPDNS